jgi:hypothetical protein
MKSEADADARKPVAAGWAEQNRVKVERERSDRTLTRFCGANRWGWRAPAAAGVHQGELGERSEPNVWPRGGRDRVPTSPAVGGGGAGGAKPGQGGEGAKRPDLDAVLWSEQVGLEGAGGGWSPPGGVGRAKRAQRGATGRKRSSADFARRRRWRGGRSKSGSRLEGVLATTLTRFCGANRRGPKDGGGGTSLPAGKAGALRSGAEIQRSGNDGGRRSNLR